jgi:hypothetical protein
LVADRYRDGSVFLAGDVAHIWIPLGGFGMKAGIGDATHLAWLLPAEYRVWAGPGLLDAYEAERRPIGDLVSGAAVQIMKNRDPAMQVREGIADDSETGVAMRRAMGERIVAADASQFNSVGVQLGYYYDNSPINVNDGPPPPPFSLDKYFGMLSPTTKVPLQNPRTPREFSPEAAKENAMNAQTNATVRTRSLVSSREVKVTPSLAA